jgi:hypothetical protein
MMVEFTIIKAVISVLIITFRKTCEEITRSGTEKIANSIIAIILTGGTNIRNTLGHPQDIKVGRNET